MYMYFAWIILLLFIPLLLFKMTFIYQQITCVFHVYHFPSNLSKGKEMKKAIHIHTDDAIYV